MTNTLATTGTAGTHRQTGQRMSETAHIAQSIGDILSTPLGTRVMREDYGSLVPELIDHPQTPALDLKLASAAFMAILRWEPRIKPTRITVSPPDNTGRRELVMQANRTDGTQAADSITLHVPMGANA
jgi:phage baseplate assembly protein W